MWAAAQLGHELLTRLMERARNGGTLRPDVTTFDIQLLIELFSRRRPDDGDVHERLLTVALDGLAATGPGTDLGADAPGWANFVGGWHRD